MKNEKYLTVGTVQKYLNVGTVQKYLTVGTVQKYLTVGTVQKYLTVGTVPKFNRKIVETELNSIPSTYRYMSAHVPDCLIQAFQ